MPADNNLTTNEEFLKVVINPISLPPLHSLSSKQVSYMAIGIAAHYIANRKQDITVLPGRAELKTGFYDLVVAGSDRAAVDAKTRSRKYWRQKIQYEADIARLNFEAAQKAVGGSLPDAEIYASDTTLRKAREKKAEIEKYLARKAIINIKTGKKISLSKLACQATVNRFNELYWVSKNFEAIGNERGMGWLFVTYTAPPQYHPNPLKGKCSYDPDLGVKASHKYILSAWARVRSLLNKWGIKSGIDTYFGIRTAETHKDGSVHWHLLVFSAPDIIQCFIDASIEHFPLYGQMKVEAGDPKIGSASSYIFKYLAKGFDPSVTQMEGSAGDAAADELREQSDLASIRNGERVRAALQTMRVRQYQPFGVKNVLTLMRSINKLGEEEFQSLVGELATTVKTEIWRHPKGLKYLLEHPELFTKHDGIAPLMLIREETITIYGEKTFKVTGLKIGDHVINTQGRFNIEKA
ncbi:replication endonuclease [Pseudomonas lini]